MASCTDRPGHRRTLNAENRFNLVDEFHGLTALPVQLVDKSHDRRGAQPADLHQFNGPLLHTFGNINHHQGGIDRRQGPVGIL